MGMGFTNPFHHLKPGSLNYNIYVYVTLLTWSLRTLEYTIATASSAVKAMAPTIHGTTKLLFSYEKYHTEECKQIYQAFDIAESKNIAGLLFRSVSMTIQILKYV